MGLANWLVPASLRQRQLVTVSGVADLPLYFLHLALGWRTWWSLGVNDIRKRFVNTFLGVSWPFLQMAMLLLVIGGIYGILLQQEVYTFVPYLAAGLALWRFISLAVDMGSGSFVSAEGYIKQVSVPKVFYVMRQMVSAHFQFLMSLLAFFVIKLVFKSPFHWGMLLALPGLALLSLFCIGIAIIFAYLNTRFRDIQHFNAVLLQALFYLTPIIYPVRMLETHGKAFIAHYNPFYHLLEVVRTPLLDGTAPPAFSYLAVAGVVLVTYFFVAWLMVRMDNRIVFYL